MGRRFVIHLHQTAGGSHYDLMLETAGRLATWRLARLPRRLSVGQSLPGARLADHRRAYLNYQGPVSRGRGSVRRVDAGSYQLLARRPGLWKVRLAGRRLTGVFCLKRVRLRPAPALWSLAALGR